MNSTIYYIAFQEMVRSVTETCKERGYLLLKIFRKYFDETEKQWMGVIRGLALQIQSLRHDRDSLLSKYLFPEDEEEALRHQRRVLDNTNESRENLIEHKHLVKTMMGRANMLQDENVRLKAELDSLRKDVNAFLYDFESMRGSSTLKERLLSIDP